MSITFYDFNRLHSRPFLDQVEGRFREILQENSFVEGKYNTLLEKNLCDRLNVAHCRLVGNCTDALEMGLLVLGMKTGDKVAVPGITFHATAEAVMSMGGVPVIVDVDPHTGLLCPESMERLWNEHKFKFIIPVHIYGMPAPMDAIEKFCDPRGIQIMEDAAQAIGTMLPKYPVGGGKNLTCFSFYPTKNLGAFGDAGAMVTQDDELAQKISSLRNHGRSPQGLKTFGRNSRCDHLQAAVLQLKLPDLDSQNEARRGVAATYVKNLPLNHVSIPGANSIESSSWHLFPILVADKDEKIRLHQYLKDQGIQSMLFYERALGDEVPMLDAVGERKNAQQFAARVLCLPIHPFLSESDVLKVCQSIKDFWK